MRKVIAGSLNGNVYQFEEAAFQAVQAYLDKAAAQCAGNPDRAEVIADLEQAIADKCDSFLGKHKNVVSVEEAHQLLSEMGAVPSDTAQPATAACADAAPRMQAAPSSAPQQRRLYRLPNKGVVGGVCSGLAAYFGIDVVWVRLFYVLMAISTGLWFFVWLVQLCITPKAVTSEEMAAAHGQPFSARNMADRARHHGQAAAESLSDAANNLRNAFSR
jgi:phage shock protein PspC (stress-responsive transcriptional regulator)